jgi:aminoglycoside 2''-phosphotransferase
MLADKNLTKLQIIKFKKIINQDYPGFVIKNIKALKSGWDNFVLEVNGNYIFRFPKNKDFNLNREIKLLKYLEGKISLNIPVYNLIGVSLPYVAYQKISGQPLLENTLKKLNHKQKQVLASDIAFFFSEFHSSLPLKKYKTFDLKEGSQAWRPIVIRKKVLGKLKNKELSDFIASSLDKYLEMIKDRKNLVIAYNDLHGNNMAFDRKKRKLNGIFDFSDVAVEDVHKEFCSLLSLDYQFAVNVIKKYEKLTKRKIDISKVILTAIVCEASELGVFIKKPESKNYRYALNDLLKLKKLSITLNFSKLKSDFLR